jgi:hypothetical protein
MPRTQADTEVCKKWVSLQGLVRNLWFQFFLPISMLSFFWCCWHLTENQSQVHQWCFEIGKEKEVNREIFLSLVAGKRKIPFMAKQEVTLFNSLQLVKQKKGSKENARTYKTISFFFFFFSYFHLSKALIKWKYLNGTFFIYLFLWWDLLSVQI